MLKDVVDKIRAVQFGLQYLAVMNFTSHLWPPHSFVKNESSFDYIIVGAGTAGSVVANRLTENENVSVLLIEAGGDTPLESVVPGCALFLKRSLYDWNYTAQNDGMPLKCHQTPNFEFSAGKMLGGTSSLNYMIYSRGHKFDYDFWASITQSEKWKWENVLPYFKKSERIEDKAFLKSADMEHYGSAGLVGLTRDTRKDADDILKSFGELGHNISNDPGMNLGYTKPFLYLTSSGRQSSAFSYLTPIKNRKNLHVLKHTLVTKVNFNKELMAEGVEAVTDDGDVLIFKASKEVIISAGTFNTPKLLMLSGIGHRKHLESHNIQVIVDLPVGDNLKDHVGVIILNSMEKAKPKPFSPNMYPAIPILGFSAIDRYQGYPDYETMSFKTQANFMLYFCVFAYRLNYSICDRAYQTMVGKNGLMNVIFHLKPKSRGHVKLQSDDPRDPPIINTGYFSELADLDDLVDYILHFTAIFNSTYFNQTGAKTFYDIGHCNNIDKDSDVYWKCYAKCMFSGLSNFVGTCAMGTVVDERLQVYGVQRLRVIDASVMPEITRGNINGPVTMIAEKGSEFIKKENPIN